MVDARGGARQHRNVGKTASACGIQAAVHALFGFQARLPEVGLPVNPPGADHAAFGAQHEGFWCFQGRADVGHLSPLQQDVHNLIVPRPMGVHNVHGG